jgi:transcriptional regulator with XRE-family HTH domain
MDLVRLGLVIRALRRRRGWTQSELARRANVTRALIGRLERGEAATARLRDVDRTAEALGARVIVRLLWHGEDLDRLLDSEHARLVDWTLRWLSQEGWQAHPEVTYAIGGERGSIDVLAHHAATDSLLIVEVKSVVPDAQAMLSALDRKARLGPKIASERDLVVRRAGRLLVLPADRTARRRVEQLRTTFQAALPDRTPAVRRWIARPGIEAAEPGLAGIIFVPNVTATSTRHRMPASRRGP